MPTLNWIGKEKVINHHQDVPYRILEHKYGFNNKKQDKAETKSGNKIIHGDNLEALKALLPEYEGKIKCIYIDPPYNTGEEKWVYNDNVNHPKIKKWLGQVVGKQEEDLSRHDKWLCMIYPRLKLLFKLLSDDGVIFISIDENENHHLRILLDEIFGINNFIEQITWNKRIPKNDKGIGNIHEYILLYAKNNSYKHRFTQQKEGLENIQELLDYCKRKKLSIEETELELKKLYKKEGYDRGITLYNSVDENYKPWGKINVSWPNAKTEGPRYDVVHPLTKKPCKVPDRGWRWTKETFDDLLDYNNIKILNDKSVICGKIWFAKDENTQPSSIKYLYEVEEFLLRSIISTKSSGGIELNDILPKSGFDYPKPIELITKLIKAIAGNNFTILDSFAGSGTTAHAVLNINKEDGGNRKFILVEMEDYVDSITAERIKRVINGYSNMEGTGGAFDYYELGIPLFKDSKNLNEEVPLENIRQYIFYTETGQPLEEMKSDDNEYFLNIHHKTAYYFYYKKSEATTLDYNFLSTVKSKTEQYVIYADNCLLDTQFLLKKNIIFKKIPRDITKL